MKKNVGVKRTFINFQSIHLNDRYICAKASFHCASSVANRITANHEFGMN